MNIQRIAQLGKQIREFREVYYKANSIEKKLIRGTMNMLAREMISLARK